MNKEKIKRSVMELMEIVPLVICSVVGWEIGKILF